MRRREVIRGGLGLLSVCATGGAFAARPCPPSLSGGSASPCPEPEPGSGAIATLAAGMASGTWARLTTTTNLQSILDSYYPRSGGGIRSFLEYSIDAKWHSGDREIHFIGGGHPGPVSPSIHLVYSEETGAWRENADANANGHTYSNFAMNPITKECYSRNNGSDAIRYWPGSGTQQWATISSTGDSNYAIADALEWWPAANNGNGGLLYYTQLGNSGRCKLSNPSVTSWNNSFATGVTSSSGGDYHVAALWCPGQRVMMIGGGNGRRDFYQLNTNGTASKRADLPAHWGPAFEGSNGSGIAFSNGRIFLLSLGRNSLFEYNYAADSWSSRGSLPFGRFWQAACAIDSFGVIHVMAQEASSQSPIQEWLYKL